MHLLYVVNSTDLQAVTRGNCVSTPRYLLNNTNGVCGQQSGRDNKCRVAVTEFGARHPILL